MKECPRCRGNMLEGVILNARNLQNWIEGEPVRSFWTGLQPKDRAKYEVTTWRCDRCGYLESYAQTPIE